MISIASTGIYRKARRLGKSLSCRTETMLTSIERPTLLACHFRLRPILNGRADPPGSRRLNPSLVHHQVQDGHLRFV